MPLVLPTRQRRCFHVDSQGVDLDLDQPVESSTDEALAAKKLPLQCHGCGAFAQISHANEAGFYDLKRKAVRKFLGLEEQLESPEKDLEEKDEEDFVVDQALQSLEPEKLEELGIDPRTFHYGEETESHMTSKPNTTPLCDRCHKLVHHREGTPIFHPNVDALRETIGESPYKYNHIYHVIDAADFPMSLLPRLHQLLGDVSLRRKNRRSRAGRYYQDRQFEMSFIITRADLLTPTEKQANSLMPYLRDTLRDALGSFGKHIRLGNLRVVSAKRGWWTKELKQEIYKRGGAGWMVGKVNVGKSQLFEAVFPKGTTADIPASRDPIEVSMFAREEDSENARYIEDEVVDGEEEKIDPDSLLPPTRPEVNYPEMPTVSSLPGTTASPIRIPFGNGKGELIDLPGLARSDLELFVQEEHRQSMIMQKRIKPTQYSIKPGQSLLLGGLIRITPKTPNLIFLGYNFTPLEEHLTATDKAIGFHDQTRTAPGVVNIATPEAASQMAHAGTFQLRHDVTKLRAGPLTRKDAINLDIERLPFRVLSTDILVEGVGWVELTAQVRTKQLYARPIAEEAPQPDPEELAKDPFAVLEQLARDGKKGESAPRKGPTRGPTEPNWPLVDVYSPLGKFVGSRAPMNGWLLNKPRVLDKHKKARPRKSMKGAKKREKLATRAPAGGAASTAET
ncbi:hypothetical protein SODALDRAFT_268999 [Sodiomyces alkalinus F11]|uniref:Genetic interactor of prohibitins 3, mitochondrial n=1 Tax=Sodiomyces alkalinus (strain CBS 110278 / VKM F-3762 / F11) TaxID=1314773 RepID=A0A3N2Q9H9_SODAK|nr:hypothetical protein SODALDRAFT_268999 [Sodiomyces alkalinus F11]ROT43396.1 hypothetical protein SODALDRAFT_268999 [Sodiomyces alkalinus F11]